MKIIHIPLIYFFITTVILIIGGWLLLRNINAAKPVTGETLLNLQVQNNAGESVKLADYATKPLILTSWNSNECESCYRHLQSLIETQQSNTNIRVIAINRGQPKENVSEFLQSLENREALIYLYDAKQRFVSETNAENDPLTIFMTQDGTIVERTNYDMTPEDIQTIVDSIVEVTT